MTAPLIDMHCHWFTPGIVASCAGRPEMVAELKLDVVGAGVRLDPADLQVSADEDGLRCCVLLPTAPPHRVRETNRAHRAAAAAFPALRSFETLHPAMEDAAAEIRAGLERGARGWKLSSFSQRFAPDDPATDALLEALARESARHGVRPVLVLDTYTRADVHFGADPRHVTTPARLVALARRHPGLAVVGAHMGGLAADPAQLRRELVPVDNLYLDTSNAGHVLPPETFAALANAHGPERVLFGTDWPWFVPGRELPLVRSLLARAGFDEAAQDRVFGGNALLLMGG